MDFMVLSEIENTTFIIPVFLGYIDSNYYSNGYILFDILI